MKKLFRKQHYTVLTDVMVRTIEDPRNNLSTIENVAFTLGYVLEKDNSLFNINLFLSNIKDAIKERHKKEGNL